MELLRNIDQMRRWRREVVGEGKSLGFVPTMGFLHEGHMSLVRDAVADNDLCVVSVFVNPAQFGPEMDLDRYPRDLDRDLALLREAGVQAVFTPDEEMMYPKGFRTWVEVEEMTDRLDGGSRPGYFRGIATIVLKLFNLVGPSRAYFGLKDVQQAMMIKRMVLDLNLDLEVLALPTVREADGLAMSSRNAYIEDEDRPSALKLSRALQVAREAFAQGERNAEVLVKIARAVLEADAKLKVDYVEVVDLDRFQPQTLIESEVTLALACDLAGTRLIDNLILRP